MAKFNILNKAEKIADYVLIITEKSPKKLRCDIVPELRKITFRILEDIVRANFYSITENDVSNDVIAERKRYQEDCLSSIRVLETFAEITNKRNYISNAQLEYLTTLTFELFNMVTNWQISDMLRLNRLK